MITRARWESGKSPGEMIRSALHWVKNPERKLRLYRIALVRRVWDELPWISRVLAEIAERQADGEFDLSLLLPRSLEYMAEEILLIAELWRGRDEVNDFPHYGINQYDSALAKIGYVKPLDPDQVEPTDRVRFYELACLAYRVHFEWVHIDLSAPSEAWSVGREFDSVPLIREVFGNPFRPVMFNPAWRTDTALSLARQMYDSRDFGAMPILADALQDAGCEDEQILHHCRDANQVHVRGCWVVDLVLGKQ